MRKYYISNRIFNFVYLRVILRLEEIEFFLYPLQGVGYGELYLATLWWRTLKKRKHSINSHKDGRVNFTRLLFTASWWKFLPIKSLKISSAYAANQTLILLQIERISRFLRFHKIYSSISSRFHSRSTGWIVFRKEYLTY